MVCECVDDFWKGTDIDRRKMVIDSDQILSIFIYIIIKAAIPSLMA